MVSHIRIDCVIHRIARKQEQGTREFYFKLSLIVMIVLTTCLFFYGKVSLLLLYNITMTTTAYIACTVKKKIQLIVTTETQRTYGMLIMNFIYFLKIPKVNNYYNIITIQT